MKIEKVNAYKCPICKDIHKIAPLASACLKKCTLEQKASEKAKRLAGEKELLKNSVRLEATSLEHAIQLLTKMSKETYGVEWNLRSYPDRLEMHPNSHDAPLGKPTNWGSDLKLPRGYLSYHGTWEGTFKGNYSRWGDRKEKAGLSDVLDKYHGIAYGFHTGSGSSGDQFHMDGTIYVEDFPKIWKRMKPLYEGNFLCCTLNAQWHCSFCDTKWCSTHSHTLNGLSSWVKECPFDGYKLNG
jgi:hypothetical protein